MTTELVPEPMVPDMVPPKVPLPILLSETTVSTVTFEGVPSLAWDCTVTLNGVPLVTFAPAFTDVIASLLALISPMAKSPNELVIAVFVANVVAASVFVNVLVGEIVAFQVDGLTNLLTTNAPV